MQAAGVPSIELSYAPSKPALLGLAESHGLSVAREADSPVKPAAAAVELVITPAEPSAALVGPAEQGQTERGVRASRASTSFVAKSGAKFIQDLPAQPR